MYLNYPNSLKSVIFNTDKQEHEMYLNATVSRSISGLKSDKQVYELYSNYQLLMPATPMSRELRTTFDFPQNQCYHNPYKYQIQQRKREIHGSNNQSQHQNRCCCNGSAETRSENWKIDRRKSSENPYKFQESSKGNQSPA